MNSLWKDRKRKKKKITTLDGASSLFVLSQWSSCSQAWRLWPRDRPASKDLFRNGFGFFRLRFVIGSKVSRHFLNQSEAKPEPFMTFASRFDWFSWLWARVVIGQSYYFGSGLFGNLFQWFLRGPFSSSDQNRPLHVICCVTKKTQLKILVSSKCILGSAGKLQEFTFYLCKFGLMVEVFLFSLQKYGNISLIIFCKSSINTL